MDKQALAYHRHMRRVAREAKAMDEIKAMRILLRVADLADNLYDALFAQQDLWSDPKYREIQVAAVKVDMALQDLESEAGYVRQENRA